LLLPQQMSTYSDVETFAVESSVILCQVPYIFPRYHCSQYVAEYPATVDIV
jgi:hypothetical protein